MINTPSSSEDRDGRRLPVVLLIDDSTDEREMYALHLEACGFQIMQAATALGGFEMAVGYFPDVVVTDVAMPGSEDGFSLVKRLKDDARTARTPVIVLTGHAFAVHREEAHRVHCDLFLAKPCVPTELERAIRDVLAKASRSRQLTMREPAQVADSRPRARNS
jgi:CheY-like chemotaxis protein